MGIRQKILDTIYKHNKSSYGASSVCIEVVYDHDLTDDLVKLFSLHIVSNRRKLLIAFLMDMEDCYGMDDKEKAEKCVDDYLSNL